MKPIFIIATLALGLSTGFSAEGEAKPGDKPKPDFEKMFSAKDKNADGKLSKEEFLAKAKDAAKAEKGFEKLDKDKDGFLSKEEFTKRGKPKAE